MRRGETEKKTTTSGHYCIPPTKRHREIKDPSVKDKTKDDERREYFYNLEMRKDFLNKTIRVQITKNLKDLSLLRQNYFFFSQGRTPVDN